MSQFSRESFKPIVPCPVDLTQFYTGFVPGVAVFYQCEPQSNTFCLLIYVFGLYECLLQIIKQLKVSSQVMNVFSP